MLELGSFRFPKGARKKRKRVGRGASSGHGSTCCRGVKGQKSRSGPNKGAGFEGGQMPLVRRVPKFGFNNYNFRTEYATVNVGNLATAFEADAEVNIDVLKKLRLVRSAAKRLKILGDGELSIKLVVKAHKFSKTAAEKIAQAGGTAEVI